MNLDISLRNFTILVKIFTKLDYVNCVIHSGIVCKENVVFRFCRSMANASVSFETTIVEVVLQYHRNSEQRQNEDCNFRHFVRWSMCGFPTIVSIEFRLMWATKWSEIIVGKTLRTNARIIWHDG